MPEAAEARGLWESLQLGSFPTPVTVISQGLHVSGFFPLFFFPSFHGFRSSLLKRWINGWGLISTSYQREDCGRICYKYLHKHISRVTLQFYIVDNMWAILLKLPAKNGTIFHTPDASMKRKKNKIKMKSSGCLSFGWFHQQVSLSEHHPGSSLACKGSFSDPFAVMTALKKKWPTAVFCTYDHCIINIWMLGWPLWGLPCPGIMWSPWATFEQTGWMKIQRYDSFGKCDFQPVPHNHKCRNVHRVMWSYLWCLATGSHLWLVAASRDHKITICDLTSCSISTPSPTRKKWLTSDYK